MIFMPYRVDEILRSMSDRDLRVRTPIEEIRMLLDAPEGEKPKEAPQEVEDIPIVIKEERIKQERNKRSNSRYVLKKFRG